MLSIGPTIASPDLIEVPLSAAIRCALQGGRQLTRNELNGAPQRAEIPTENVRLAYTIMQAALDAIICSGPRHGKQFTYMLLDERLP